MKGGGRGERFAQYMISPADKAYIAAMLRFHVTKYRLPQSTVISNKGHLGRCCRYLNSIGKELSVATTADLQFYLDNHFQSNKSCYYFVVLCLKQMYEFLIQEGVVAESPMKLIDTSKAPVIFKKQQFVPSLEQIIRCRNYLNTKHIRQAVIFELLLSSGMRDGELSQLRVCDIKFGTKVVDKETGLPSAYVGGSIELRIDQINIKRSKSRTVYFSVLAAKVLRKYLEVVGIANQPNFPVVPWAERTRTDYFMALGKAIGINAVLRDEKGNLTISTVRKSGFADIAAAELNSSGISESMKRVIMARQKQAATIASAYEANELPPDIQERHEKRPAMTAHALRRAFTCIQHYRSHKGSENDLAFVVSQLGHSGFQSIDRYLVEMQYLTSRSQWNMLMLGRPSEYRNILCG